MIAERFYPMSGGTGSPRAHGLIADVSGDSVVPLFVAHVDAQLVTQGWAGAGLRRPAWHRVVVAGAREAAPAAAERHTRHLIGVSVQRGPKVGWLGDTPMVTSEPCSAPLRVATSVHPLSMGVSSTCGASKPSNAKRYSARTCDHRRLGGLLSIRGFTARAAA